MIGVFGGSGFYQFLEDATPAPVDTPFGSPSSEPLLGSIEGEEVVFIPRHGRHHQFPPHLVPYRANVDAMRRLGVDRIVAATAAGSLQRDIEPGDFVVPDQLVDRTWGRDHTFCNGPEVDHLTFAAPYHPVIRELALKAMRTTGATAHDGATVVVVQGPRFSTRAESRSFAAAGWDLVNMTQMPEAALAAEAGLAYANVSVVTDYDSGVEGAEPVTHEAVLERFEQASDLLKQGIRSLIRDLAMTEISPGRE